MYKYLVYNNETLKNFKINEKGVIKSSEKDVTYKNYINKAGYIVCSLPMGKRGSVKNIRIHKALAETFLEKPVGCDVVHHIDGNKTNYALTNLQWVTYKQNTHYYLQNIKHTECLFNNRKLTLAEAELIRSMKEKYSLKELAILFKVSKTTISNIVNNKHYADGI